MRQFRRNAKIATVIFCATFVVAQAFRIEKTNPPVHSDIVADQSVKSLLHRACYNCHSNETVWPWYSNVAPVSWLVGNDVKEARRHMNFSDWGTYSSSAQSRRLEAIAEVMKEGEMPPWYYSIMHPESRLSDSERNEIRNWAAQSLALSGTRP